MLVPGRRGSQEHKGLTSRSPEEQDAGAASWPGEQGTVTSDSSAMDARLSAAAGSLERYRSEVFTTDRRLQDCPGSLETQWD